MLPTWQDKHEAIAVRKAVKAKANWYVYKINQDLMYRDDNIFVVLPTVVANEVAEMYSDAGWQVGLKAARKPQCSVVSIRYPAFMSKDKPNTSESYGSGTGSESYTGSGES